ncbi:MAG: BTAD domain-containing putative transcriptional regulator [Caldilineaceae bacterium]
MPKLTLHFFGGFQAWLDDKPFADFRSGRVQNLLAYLVLEAKQPHPRTTLAALFWPDEPESAAKQNLRQALYQLRQLLGEANAAEAPSVPFLLITRDTVQFNPASAYTLDVAAFQAHIAQQQLAAAVALYQGDLLTSLSSDSPAFEEWLLFQRESLHIQVLGALTQLTTDALEQTDYPQAQQYARRQLALEPWREEAHRQLLLALARSGDRSAALAQYEACRRILQEELGVEPDAETQAVVEDIRGGREPGARGKEQGTEDRGQKAEGWQVGQRDIAGTTFRIPHSALRTRLDWGEAPDIGLFHGREAELAELENWLVRQQCRVVTLLGMGGIGKTSLTARLMRQVADAFEFVFWRSLVNAPPLPDILQACLQFLTDNQSPTGPLSLDAQLNQLFEQLRQHRCLLVLDNAESIMLGGERASYYRPGYELYGQLFKRMGESAHQSCLVITSRELPHEVVRLERSSMGVRSLPLAGLTPAAGQAVLQAQGLRASPDVATALVQRYSGNPLALILVAETIQELFDGDVDAFLHEEAPIFDDIRDILEQQFRRLSGLEQDILRWLALEREPLSVQQLSANFPQPVAKRVLLEALSSLRRRSLLEKTSEQMEEDAQAPGNGFTLQNVVTEYITDTITEQICREIEQVAPVLLKSHALLKAQSREYVRQSQRRLLLQPIGERLQAQLGRSALVARLRKLLDELRCQPDHLFNYGGGNVLNLLLHLGVDLHQADFSQLAVWQGYLQGASLPAVNFNQSDFKACAFTDTFGAVTALSFSANGQRLAAGLATGAVRLWQTTDGQALGVLEGHTNYVFSVCFTPDDQTLVSGSDDQSLRLWDVAHLQAAEGAAGGGPLLQTLQGHSQGVWCARLSPDGRYLVSASGDHTLCLWDMRTRLLVRTFHGHEAGVRAVAFSWDGDQIASGDERGFLRIWQTQTGEIVNAWRGHTTTVWALAFSPDGQWLASGCYDQQVRLWSVARLPRTATTVDLREDTTLGPILLGHTHNVTAVAFSPDSKTLISGARDQTVRLWDVGPHGQGQVRHILQGHTDSVNCIAVSPDGALVASGSDDQSIRLWDAHTGHALHTLRGHTQGILGMAFSPDGNLLANACQDHQVQLWTLPAKQRRAPLQGHSKDIYTVAFSADGSLLASGSSDHTIRLWEVAAARVRFVLRGHQGWVRALRFSPDGKRLVSSSNDWKLHLWDVQTGELLRVLDAPFSVWSLDFAPNAPNGQLLASAGTGRMVRLWNLVAPEHNLNLHGHTNWVTSVAFNTTGALLASGSADQTIRLWDMQTGEMHRTLTGHQAWVYSVAFQRQPQNSTLLASGSADKTVCLWDVERGELLNVLPGHTNDVRAVAFSPDGALLVSGSLDETVRLWDVQSGRCLDVLRAPRPYEGMNIAQVTGITEAQKNMLKALGALEAPQEP